MQNKATWRRVKRYRKSRKRSFRIGDKKLGLVGLPKPHIFVSFGLILMFALNFLPRNPIWNGKKDTVGRWNRVLFWSETEQEKLKYMYTYICTK